MAKTTQQKREYKYVIGVDEVGTGAIAGPITMCACYVPPSQWDELRSWGFTDSKKLSENRRTELYRRVSAEGKNLGVKWSCASVEPIEIDKMTPLDAQFKAARTAILLLVNQLKCDFSDVAVLLDGVHTLPNLPPSVHQIALPKADLNYLPVSAASVIAKHTRDSDMRLIHESFPLYNFARNKGYPTLEHLTMLLKLRPIYGIHRRYYLKGLMQAHFEKYMKFAMERPEWLDTDVWLSQAGEEIRDLPGDLPIYDEPKQ